MIYLLALLPATALTVAGYFVLYLSNRSEGALRTFGRYLGFWAFTLAGLVVLGALFAAAAHGGHRGALLGMHGIHAEQSCPWSGGGRFGPDASAAPPSPPAGGTNPALSAPPTDNSGPAQAH